MSKDNCYYTNTDAKGGKPMAQGAQDASMRKIDSATKHLTQPSGSAKSIGDLPPQAKTPKMKSEMGAVAKVAGGSNY